MTPVERTGRPEASRLRLPEPGLASPQPLFDQLLPGYVLHHGDEVLRLVVLISHERQKQLAKVGSWERHIKSDTIHWSEEIFQIFGLTNSAPSNFPTFLSCVHPKDREKILGIDDKVRRVSHPLKSSTDADLGYAESRMIEDRLKDLGIGFHFGFQTVYA